MTADQLRSVHKAAPFEPFTIHMADGRTFEVPHPDFLSMAPSGRIVIVYGEGDVCSFLDLFLMTEIKKGAPSKQGT